MTTPAEHIAMLDRSLAREGQDVEMYRLVGTGPTATKQGLGAPIRAHVRTLGVDELTGTLSQDDRLVTLSPTSFAGWAAGTPKKGDKVVLDGQACNVEVAMPIKPQGILVRLELKVKG